MEIILLRGWKPDFKGLRCHGSSVKRNDEGGGMERRGGRANSFWVFASPRYELLFSLIGFQFLPVVRKTSSVSSQKACIMLIRSKG